MSLDLLLSTPSSPPRLADAINRFANHGNSHIARYAFAYVSLAGIEDAFGNLQHATAYSQLKKLWVVGIHNGITEPAAIEFLANSPATDVRIHSGSGKIDKAALAGKEKLHAKTIHISGHRGDLLIIGSANVTRAALGAECRNFEAVASIHTTSSRDRSAFTNWFEMIWNDSLPVNASVLDSYSHLRDEFLKQNRVVLPRLDEAPQQTITTRTHLWIDAGAMSGGDRNQVEFGPLLASFFGPLRRESVNLRLKWNAIERADRPLSHKVTQWGTEIWRFSLITSNQGGPAYPGNIIHFSRHMDARGTYFLLNVASPDSSEANLWRRLANRSGTLAWTGIGVATGREYGVY